MPSTLEVLKSKVKSYQEVLRDTPPAHKKERVTVGLAQNFNELLTEVCTECPDLAKHLPKPITWERRGTFTITDMTYVDVEILTTQVSKLLDHVRG